MLLFCPYCSVNSNYNYSCLAETKTGLECSYFDMFPHTKWLDSIRLMSGMYFANFPYKGTGRVWFLLNCPFSETCPQ